jgi:hypothetical protein
MKRRFPAPKPSTYTTEHGSPRSISQRGLHVRARIGLYEKCSVWSVWSVV